MRESTKRDHRTVSKIRRRPNESLQPKFFGLAAKPVFCGLQKKKFGPISPKIFRSKERKLENWVKLDFFRLHSKNKTALSEIFFAQNVTFPFFGQKSSEKIIFGPKCLVSDDFDLFSVTGDRFRSSEPFQTFE